MIYIITVWLICLALGIYNATQGEIIIAQIWIAASIITMACGRKES
jgi:hypothetical protein